MAVFHPQLLDKYADLAIDVEVNPKECQSLAFRITVFDLTDEALSAAEGNQRMTHVDLMIGLGEMVIHGITEDGATEPLMRNGEWAFEV